VVGPSDAGASSQVQYINTLITQRQDAIVIAANDANAVVPYLKKAMAQGIKVVTFDSDTAPEGRQIFVNQANSEGIGRGQVQLMRS
jgi:rhamnose transport system substrate-binding protein